MPIRLLVEHQHGVLNLANGICIIQLHYVNCQVFAFGLVSQLGLISALCVCGFEWVGRLARVCEHGSSD